MKKVLISDIDGTFLNIDNSLPLNTKKFINKIKEMGFEFMLASSRPPYSISNLFSEFIPDYFLFANDGGVIMKSYDSGLTVLNEYNLNRKEITLTNQIIADNNSLTQFYFTDSKNKFEVGIHNNFLGKQELKIIFPNRKIEILNAEDRSQYIKKHSFRAISLFGKNELINSFNDSIDENLKINLKCYKYLETRFLEEKFSWIDFMPKNLSKGSSLLDFKKKQNYDFIVALGNGVNDIELFSEADFSISPSNAVDSLKKSANVVSEKICGEEFLEDVLEKINSL